MIQQEGLPECRSSVAALTEHWHFSYSTVGYCTGYQCSLQLVRGRQETTSAQHGGTRAGGRGSCLRTTAAMAINQDHSIMQVPLSPLPPSLPLSLSLFLSHFCSDCCRSSIGPAGHFSKSRYHQQIERHGCRHRIAWQCKHQLTLPISLNSGKGCWFSAKKVIIVLKKSLLGISFADLLTQAS